MGTKTQKQRKCCYHNLNAKQLNELKIRVGQQRTITNRQKVQTLYFFKAGSCQSITDVSERLGVHKTTVQRWLKQYNEGGMDELLKIRYSPGRRRSNPLSDSRRTLDKN